VWDATTGKRLLKVGDPGVIDVAFSPDGRWLATTGISEARVWDSRSGSLRTTLVGHTGDVFTVAFSPDGKRIATGSSDATARVWDAASGRQLLVLAGHTQRVTGVQFSPDGSRLLTASREGTARVWDVSPAGARDALTLPAHGGGAFTLSYSPDGSRLLTGGIGDPPALLWDGSTGRRLRVLAAPADVSDARFSPDGRRIVLAPQEGGVAPVVDAATGRVILELRPGADFVPSTAWSPDGRAIAFAVDDTAAMLDAETGELIRTFVHTVGNPFFAWVGRVAFTPDGSRLVTAAGDGTVRVWNVATGEVVLESAAHTGTERSIYGLAVSRDGRRLATSSSDGTAKTWALPSGRLLATLVGHYSGIVTDVAFSPDGNRVATVGDDTTVRLWDAATGRQLLTLTGATLGVWSVAFSPDGRRLAAASADGNVRTYFLPLDELMAEARSRLTRGWTRAECRQFLATDQCPEGL
jgi:WD40 repeat protein